MEGGKRIGSYPVYCQTPKERCCDGDMFLGWHPAGVAVRCDICGRWTRYEPGRKGVEHGQGKDPGTEAG